MITDPDIYLAATVILKRYGADASMQVTERADEMLERGDLAGAAVWRRILMAVEELLREPNESVEAN